MPQLQKDLGDSRPLQVSHDGKGRDGDRETEMERGESVFCSKMPTAQGNRFLDQSENLPTTGWGCPPTTQWAFQTADTWTRCKVLNRGLWPLAFSAILILPP